MVEWSQFGCSKGKRFEGYLVHPLRVVQDGGLVLMLHQVNLNHGTSWNALPYATMEYPHPLYIYNYIYISIHTYIYIYIHIYHYIYIIMCIYIDNHIIIYPYQFHIPCPGRAWSSWWARIVTRCWWPFCRWPPPFRATSGCNAPPWPPAPFPMGALASPPSHWGRENAGCSTEPC